MPVLFSTAATQRVGKTVETTYAVADEKNVKTLKSITERIFAQALHNQMRNASLDGCIFESYSKWGIKDPISDTTLENKLQA